MYKVPTSTTIHSIPCIQTTCPTVPLDNPNLDRCGEVSSLIGEGIPPPLTTIYHDVPPIPPLSHWHHPWKGHVDRRCFQKLLQIFFIYLASLFVSISCNSKLLCVRSCIAYFCCRLLLILYFQQRLVNKTTGSCSCTCPCISKWMCACGSVFCNYLHVWYCCDTLVYWPDIVMLSHWDNISCNMHSPWSYVCSTTL